MKFCIRTTTYGQLIYLVPLWGHRLLYTLIKFAWVSKQDAGNERMQEISRYIAEGAMAFLKAEWKILSYFVVLAGSCLRSWVIVILSHTVDRPAFILGAVAQRHGRVYRMRSATKGQCGERHRQPVQALARP